MTFARLAAAALCVIALSATLAEAGPYRSYGSYGPPRIRPGLSPYLDLFRQDTGALPNYYQFVRPQVRLQNIVTQQYNTSMILGTRTTRLEQDITGEFRTRSSAAPTGNYGGFQNYSHFYSRRQPGIGR